MSSSPLPKKTEPQADVIKRYTLEFVMEAKKELQL